MHSEENLTRQAVGPETIAVTQLDAKTVMVNDIPIEEDAIQKEIQQSSQSWERAAANLVVRELLLLEVDKDTLDRQGEEQAIQKLLEQQIELPAADEETCQRYYDNNRQLFNSPTLYEASHILLAAAPDDLALREKLCTQAKEIISELQQTPEQFAELALAHSSCPSRKMGGSLGQISKGSTVPEFEQQLFKMEQGLHPVPLESRYGYHAVRVDRKVNGELLDFSVVREAISSRLYRQVQHQAISTYINQLVESAEISGIDLQSLRYTQN